MSKAVERSPHPQPLATRPPLPLQPAATGSPRLISTRSPAFDAAAASAYGRARDSSAPGPWAQRRHCRTRAGGKWRRDGAGGRRRRCWSRSSASPATKSHSRHPHMHPPTRASRPAPTLPHPHPRTCTPHVRRGGAARRTLLPSPDYLAAHTRARTHART